MDPEDIEALGSVWRSAALLLLLAKLEGAAGESEAAFRLGIDAATARRHLRFLSERGMLTRRTSHNGYMLTNLGWQVVQTESARFARKSAQSTRNSAQKARFGGSTTTTALNSRKMGNREAVEVVEAENAQNARISAQSTRISAQSTRFQQFAHIRCRWVKRPGEAERRAAELLSALQAANLAALRAEGLGVNHRVQRVCRLPHVTPEYIAGQARRLRQERRFAATLLLHIVESGDPLPPPLDPYQEEAEDRQRYIRGPYADIIDH